jgi:hypothetical protein
MRARVANGGPGLAAAGILVAVATFMAEMRMAGEWSVGFVLAMNLVAAAAVLGVGLVAARGEGRPDGPATALLIAGLALALAAVVGLADVLGAEGGEGSIALTALAFAGIAAYVAWTRSSPVTGLIAAAALAATVIAAVVGIFDADEVDTFRVLFLALAVAFALAAWRIESIDKHLSVQLVNAAGLAVLALVVTLSGVGLGFPFQVFAGSGAESANEAFGWELASLLACAALVAYAVVRREPGPGYLGAICTVYALAAAAGPSEEQTLVGWPLVLIALAAVAVVDALRAPAQSRTEP